MTVADFQQLAAYNRWANGRIYAAALAMTEAAYRTHTGVFFGSLQGTLNHLLLVDRLWLWRLTGEGDHVTQLDAIIAEDRIELARARSLEDARIIKVIAGYDAAMLTKPHRYQTTQGQPQEQPLGDILLHFFNHQTHHRGQAHACCSILLDAPPPSLDLLAFQRGAPAPDLHALT